MAFYRTALRLAAIESLAPAALLGTTGPFPTLAGPRVYDTRIDPINDLAPGETKAAIVVYTEADIGYGSQKRGGPPFRREVDLVFEISQIVAAPSDSDPSVYVAGVPQTDRELEADLDRIETEISLALLYSTNGLTITRGAKTIPGATTPVGGTILPLWRYLTGSCVTEPRSTPHRTSEEAVRLAMRSVCWKVQCPDDLFDLQASPGPSGLDRLPEPLQSIALVLATSPVYAPLLSGLAQTMPTPPAAKLLDSIGLNVQMLTKGAAASGAENVSALIPFPLWTWTP